MMTHVEVLTALNASASTHPFAAAAIPAAKKVFVAHASALANVQNTSDGRWHQLLNDTSAASFLETSCTAMYIVAMVRGVDAGWLDGATFNPVITRAWGGLSRTIHRDGFVSGMCDGFGIHSAPADYYACKQLYGKSQPGLGSVLKAAVLLASRGA
jgi:rhamnogalacturonyl hydrolase YesR|eukprot:SAG25_NODE_673_length_6002_cov_4.287481_3_plen_156_part_00